MTLAIACLNPNPKTGGKQHAVAMVTLLLLAHYDIVRQIFSQFMQPCR